MAPRHRHFWRMMGTWYLARGPGLCTFAGPSPPAAAAAAAAAAGRLLPLPTGAARSFQVDLLSLTGLLPMYLPCISFRHCRTGQHTAEAAATAAESETVNISVSAQDGARCSCLASPLGPAEKIHDWTVNTVEATATAAIREILVWKCWKRLFVQGGLQRRAAFHRHPLSHCRGTERTLILKKLCTLLLPLLMY
mgnify:FL=1